MNILEKIIDHKRTEVSAKQKLISDSELQNRASENRPALSLQKALRGKEKLSVIAEIKKASPSAGIISPNFDPVATAKGYVAAGADAISVLTDEHFFQGHLDFIPKIRPCAPVPLLRKDFIISPWQVTEARAFGADAILLIVAALEQEELRDLLALSNTLGMDALVEIHNADELETALNIDAAIIGINNRNLRTFEIDLETTAVLARQIPQDRIIVSESGIKTQDDLQRIKAANADAILVGSHFMGTNDPGAALRELSKGL